MIKILSFFVFRLTNDEHKFRIELVKDNLTIFALATAPIFFGNRLVKDNRRQNMPIVIAPTNRLLKIVRIAADDKTKKHLENLGITINGEITVLSSSGGSVVCKVKDGRIALDRNISTKIFVA